MNRKKMRALVIAAVVAAGCSLLYPAAQAQTGAMDKANSTMTGSMSAQSPAEVYGGLLKLMSQEVISAAEAMPADKYNFAPTNGKFDGVRTFGDQVQHLTGANYMFFSGFGISGAPSRDQLKALKSKDELVQALKDSYAYAQKAMDSITAQNAFTVIGNGPMGMKMTRAGAATFNLAHAMDHYGQMVEYLRMNNIVPPASQKQ